MASLMFDDNGASRFRTRSNQDYQSQTVATMQSIMPSFVSVIGATGGHTSGAEVGVGGMPNWLGTLLDAVKSSVMGFILKKDDNYTLDVADEGLCNSECYHLLRIVGAHMDELKNSHLKGYFNTDEHLFEQTIWSPGDLSKYIENIVVFCASAECGYINKTALTNILSTLLKTELAQSNSFINKTETIIVYSEKNKECGVIKLNFTGDQIKAKGCCGEGSSTKINVRKYIIMFKDSKELLLSLRTFAAKYR